MMIVRSYEDTKAESVSDAGAEKTTVRWVIAKEDGAKNFFMRVFEIAPGGCTPIHHHPWEHEVFVLQGKGCVVRDGEEVSISEGHVIFVPPEEEHQFKNTCGDTLKFICVVPSQ
jgi:quercetin dioxygenase-like cupin family protein